MGDQAPPPAAAPHTWRRLVAIGLVCGDLSPTAIARHAGVPPIAVQRALDDARGAGIVVDGAVDEIDAAHLIAELSPDTVAEIHARLARQLMTEGPTRLAEAVEHAREAGNLIPVEEIVALAEHGAQTSLSVGDYESARRLFELVDDMDTHIDPVRTARRMCGHAMALEGLGRVPEARDWLSGAFDLAEFVGDARVATQAAVRYVFPVDWYAGDSRAAALLQRAEAMDLDSEAAIAVKAARAMVEMRIPIGPTTGQQLAWITRASVAQPLANEALEASEGAGLLPRVIALLAWRTTHRAPEHLARRREVSMEALDVAQHLRAPGLQVNAAMMLAADALESGDRPRFDEALSVMRWVAEADGNPRLRWHAHATAGGAANIDGDLDLAAHHRTRARECGSAIDSPGWLAAELMLLSQELLARDDPDEMAAALPAAEDPALANPLGRAVVAYVCARLGRVAEAEAHVRRALRQIDREASLLLLGTRLVDAVAMLDLPDVVDELTAVLTPWAHHVSVDSSVWWCDGPVALWLARLAHARADDDAAHHHLDAAEVTARRMGDLRALGRIEALRAELAGSVDSPRIAAADLGLDERERAVLTMLVQGASNPEIARALSYSVSTIRNDVTAIYRKLGVRNRPEAAAKAKSLGLV